MKIRSEEGRVPSPNRSLALPKKAFTEGKLSSYAKVLTAKQEPFLMVLSLRIHATGR